MFLLLSIRFDLIIPIGVCVLFFDFGILGFSIWEIRVSKFRCLFQKLDHELNQDFRKLNSLRDSLVIYRIYRFGLLFIYSYL